MSPYGCRMLEQLGASWKAQECELSRLKDENERLIRRNSIGMRKRA